MHTRLLFSIFHSEIDKFDIYGCGQSILSTYEARSEIEDRIHFFTEECDSLQVLNTYYVKIMEFCVHENYQAK